MTTSNFNFSNAELCQRSDKLVMVYTRDEAAFSKYGYNGETIGSIKTKNADLKLFPSDDFYEGEQKMATDNKTEIRTVIENNISDLRSRTKLVLGAESVEYSLFKFSKLSRLNDNELVQYALHVVNTAKPRLEVLSKRLITQETLDVIMADRQKLDDAIDAQSTAISNRREKKFERMMLANELYKLISELSEVGKLIWKGENEAFYSDYVIYGHSKTMEEQVDEQNNVEENIEE